MTKPMPCTIVDDPMPPEGWKDRVMSFLLIVSSSVFTDKRWTIGIRPDGTLVLPEGMTPAEALFLTAATADAQRNDPRPDLMTDWARTTVEKWAPWLLLPAPTAAGQEDGRDG